MTERRTMFKGLLQRGPGQSVQAQRDNALMLMDSFPVILMTFLGVMTGTTWWMHINPYTALPATYSVMFGISVGAYLLIKPIGRRKVARLAQAVDGERYVGQTLDRLRADGYEVVQDLPADRFNVDHVVVGPAGVFTVETKTRRKRRGGGRVTFDGSVLLADGEPLPRDPIAQARGQAHWLRAKLNDLTGRRFRVHPIVVFPRWYVEQDASSSKRIWILNERYIRTRLNREPRRLSREEIALAATHLRAMARDSGN